MSTIAQTLKALDAGRGKTNTRTLKAVSQRQYVHNGWCWIRLYPGNYWAQAVIPASLQPDMDVSSDKILNVAVGAGITVQSIAYDGSKAV